jgi:DNA-binding MarR family transcriptional regulator
MLDPSPDVTRLIDKLEERGFVQRSRSEEDRRMMIHRITDDGLALLEEMAPAIDAVIDEFDRRVSDRDLEHLNRICESVYSEYADDRAP